MSLLVAICRGSIHVVKDSGGGGNGFYAIQPAIPDAEGSKVLIMGVPLDFQEIVQPTVTLDDKRILYVFGSAWSEMSVMGTLLLGSNSTRGAQVSKLIDWWNQNRVSTSKKPVMVSVGTSGVEAYLIGLRLDQANPEFNTQAFSLRFLTSKVKAQQ